MKPSLKKLCIFGLAAGIGQMIQDQINDFPDMTQDEKEIAVWNAIELNRAGMEAISNCKTKVDRSKLKQAAGKIDEISKDQTKFDVAEMLSFLFLGLNDLSHYCKYNVKPVEDAALNFICLFDSNLEDEELHQKALGKYNIWIKD